MNWRSRVWFWYLVSGIWHSGSFFQLRVQGLQSGSSDWCLTSSICVLRFGFRLGDQSPALESVVWHMVSCFWYEVQNLALVSGVWCLASGIVVWAPALVPGSRVALLCLVAGNWLSGSRVWLWVLGMESGSGFCCLAFFVWSLGSGFVFGV